jgi:hypothetical protein
VSRYSDRPASDDLVSFHDAEVVAETDKAILVRSNDLDKDTWVPKSVIDDDSEVYERDTDGTLIVKGWWARKEGLA